MYVRKVYGWIGILIRAYAHDPASNALLYMPTESDLRLFEGLSKALWENHCTAQYIERNMGQRFRGEPEGAKKFTDPSVAAYHYPQ